jgi:hypothetical protein
MENLEEEMTKGEKRKENREKKKGKERRKYK